MEALTLSAANTLVLNCDNKDIRPLFDIYFAAIDYQQKRKFNVWPDFPVELIEEELEEKRLMKLVDETTGEIQAVFSFAIENPDVWGEANPALYLHRMATTSACKGKGTLNTILSWAKNYAKENNLEAIRLDTWGDNESLTKYYQKAGFEKVGKKLIEVRTHLPEHYQGVNLNLLEIKV